jgi:hypothetical protein
MVLLMLLWCCSGYIVSVWALGELPVIRAQLFSQLGCKVFGLCCTCSCHWYFVIGYIILTSQCYHFLDTA